MMIKKNFVVFCDLYNVHVLKIMLIKSQTWSCSYYFSLQFTTTTQVNPPNICMRIYSNPKSPMTWFYPNQLNFSSNLQFSKTKRHGWWIMMKREKYFWYEDMGKTKNDDNRQKYFHFFLLLPEPNNMSLPLISKRISEQIQNDFYISVSKSTTFVEHSHRVLQKWWKFSEKCKQGNHTMRIWNGDI